MMKWHKLGDLYINEEALNRIIKLGYEENED
jgi:hypothetical protein